MSVWRKLRNSLAHPLRYAALVAGALPVLTFPAPNLEFAAWFCLVPGLLLVRAAPSAREATVRSWWFGTGFIMAAHYWLAPNLGPALLLVAIVLGVLWTPAGLSTWLLLRSPVTPGRALAALLVVPSYWLVIEVIRSWQALGGPWALLGTSQWQHPVMLALAAVGGVWLISFVLVAANVAVVIVLTARALPLRALAGGLVAVLVLAGPVAFWLLPSVTPDGSVTVAMVQPGIVHDPLLRVDASQRLTTRLRGHPGLIVWGESSIAYDLRENHTLLNELRALSAAKGAQILVNQDSVTPAGKSKVAVLVGPRGIVATYTKTRLVPFGEYIPFRQQLGWLTSVSRAAPVNMIPGTGAKVMTATLPGGRPLRIGVLICFEAAFPDMSRVDTLHGARLIVYQTSDSTFQQSWAPAQHASMVAVRAAETGRPAIQAALTGVSAAFDARGRMITWLGTSHQGVAFVRVGLAPASALTPFDRIGDVVPWVAISIAVLAALIAVTVNYPGGRPRLIGIMRDGNRRPVPSVSNTEAVGESGAAPGPQQSGGGAAPSQQAGR
ncbi:MAG TPA: apolipoprotein N-acyltransferase [Streptosporangiaceae bacterium]|jgi:apolipoprotein N-acyltransferase